MGTCRPPVQQNRAVWEGRSFKQCRKRTQSSTTYLWSAALLGRGLDFLRLVVFFSADPPFAFPQLCCSYYPCVARIHLFLGCYTCPPTPCLDLAWCLCIAAFPGQGHSCCHPNRGMGNAVGLWLWVQTLLLVALWASLSWSCQLLGEMDCRAPPPLCQRSSLYLAARRAAVLVIYVVCREQLRARLPFEGIYKETQARSQLLCSAPV